MIMECVNLKEVSTSKLQKILKDANAAKLKESVEQELRRRFDNTHLKDMQKTIEGYFVRSSNGAMFSLDEWEDNGSFDNDDYWDEEWETTDEEIDVDSLDSLFDLTSIIPDDKPYKIRITVEMEAVDCRSRLNEVQKKRIEHYAEQLASALGKSKEDVLSAVMPGDSHPEGCDGNAGHDKTIINKGLNEL
jgi:hypothetical protein